MLGLESLRQDRQGSFNNVPILRLRVKSQQEPGEHSVFIDNGAKLVKDKNHTSNKVFKPEFVGCT